MVVVEYIWLVLLDSLIEILQFIIQQAREALITLGRLKVKESLTASNQTDGTQMWSDNTVVGLH